MGQRGPARKPTALKVLHGETRPSRLHPDQPVPRAELPTAPTYLSAAAKRIWKHTAAELEYMGLLTGADQEALAMYCTAVALHAQAVREVNRDGVLVDGAVPGTRVKHPALQVIRDQATLAKGYAQQFGLTPAARASLTIGKKEDDGAGAERLLS